jgi:ABC-type Co2+ transport system permease subunit
LVCAFEEASGLASLSRAAHLLGHHRSHDFVRRRYASSLHRRVGVGVVGVNQRIRRAILRGLASSFRGYVAGVVSREEMGVLMLAARGDRPLDIENAPPEARASVQRFVLYSSPFWALGVAAEAVVTASVLTFLARVRPELVP